MLEDYKTEYQQIFEKILEECFKARRFHAPFHSSHEAHSVILEELEEWWDSVKKDEPDDKELIQVAAMAVTAILELKGKTVNSEYKL